MKLMKQVGLDGPVTFYQPFKSGLHVPQVTAAQREKGFIYSYVTNKQKAHRTGICLGNKERSPNHSHLCQSF